jgi:hypothetical protein
VEQALQSSDVAMPATRGVGGNCKWIGAVVC